MTEPSEPTETPTPVGNATTADLPPTPPEPPATPAVPPQSLPYVTPYPFAPVVKEPWFNPAKRTTILVASVVAAIVLLGSGVLIGLAAGHHDRRDRPGFTLYGPGGGQVIVPGNGQGPRFVFPGNQLPGNPFPGNGRGHQKHQPAATPSPSGSTTTS